MTRAVTRREGLILALAGTTACAVQPAAAAASRTFTVSISALAFGPPPAALRVGDTIEWVNTDIFRHTATARNGSFDADIMPGARARTLIKTAGEVAFYCRYHPNMTGTLKVLR